ncbi:hypothetical protein LJR078_000922 [Arthrobacter sp. LjRoot78]|uniref:hypothetical protein n=1 Tax=Arthrobacter sp. LjRoot78 TaxID=3342338 RepID=UPI003ED171A7
MEVLGELAAGGALRWAALPAAASAVRVTSGPGLRSVPASLQTSQALASDGGGSGDLPRSLALLKRASSTAAEDAGVKGFRAAADFAAEPPAQTTAPCSAAITTT